MSMTLEQAIEHSERVYEKKLDERSYALEWHDNEEAEKCQKCADEHRQLAEWLKELKAVKDLIKQHDEDSMPEDFWYIDEIREAVQE